MGTLYVLIVPTVFIVFGRKLRKEWSAPMYLCGVFWMLYVSASYLLMKDDYPFSMAGIVWIHITLWIMLLAENLADRKIERRNVKERTIELSTQSWLYLKSCCVFGVLGVIYQVSLYGFQFSDFTSLSTLATMNNTVAIARYAGKSITNIFTQISLIFIYAAPACGGFAFVHARTKIQKIWSTATILPCVLMVLFTNTKAGIIAVSILWISAYLISFFFRYKHSPIIKASMAFAMATIVALFFGFLLLSMTLRIGEVSSNSIQAVERKFMSYAFGSVQAFDWWCGKLYYPDYKFGAQTYLAVSNIFGLAERVQGVYAYELGTASNVYTVFRGIIEDFGFVLGILYLSVKALLCGVCFNKIRCSSKIPFFSVTFLTAEMFFLVYGFIISIWTYISYILAVVIFWGYLVCSDSRGIRVKFGKKILL